MNKKLLLAGTSALAMTMGSAAALADGAWAKINGYQDGLVLASVYNNGTPQSPTTDNGQVRPNLIDTSVNNADGVFHMQQNEGSANSINAAGAVQASLNQGGSSSGAIVYGNTYFNAALQTAGSRDNTVLNSFQNTHGVMTVQQNNGDQNEIGSAEAVQYDQAGNGDVFTLAKVHGETQDNYTSQTGGTRNNLIQDSFNGGAAGVMTVQQNNGDHNTIGAATSVYGGDDAADSFGDARQRVEVFGASHDQFGLREAVVSDNAANNVRLNTIDPSFNDASGIATVQQNNGNANAIGAATSVAANVGGAHDVPGPNNQDDVSQSVRVKGEIGNDGEGGSSVYDVVLTNSFALDRDNVIEDGSFNNFQGIASVQQNNGDVNVLGIGTAVHANAELTGNQLQNDVEQSVRVTSEVHNAYSVDDDTGDQTNATIWGDRSNRITESFNAATGVVNVQQNNGSQNVMGIGNAIQANLGTTASSLDGDDDVRRQKAYAKAIVGDNQAYDYGGPVTSNVNGVLPPHRVNRIEGGGGAAGGSFVGFEGIASVQQNNGDNNAMSVANALAATENNFDKLDNVGSRRHPAAAKTRAEVTDNTASEANQVQESGSNRLNTIDGNSFNDAKGVITVQQNNGNNNAIAAANAVVANIGPGQNAGAAADQDPLAGSVHNGASGHGEVSGNTHIGHENIDRVNQIPGTFQNVQGIITVQQNNGDNNVLAASTSVVADIDTIGSPGSGFGPAASAATLSGTVSGNTTVTVPPVSSPGLLNTINAGAFNGAQGVLTVQQNNGNNSLLQSAIAVSVNLNTTD